MIKNHDTHSAQAIYEALLKDPDLEIKEGQTREEAAKIEAEFRARQYFNNMQALSLGSEPSSSIKSLINFVSTPVSWVSDILDLVKVDGGFGISDIIGGSYNQIQQQIANTHGGNVGGHLNAMADSELFGEDAKKFLKNLGENWPSHSNAKVQQLAHVFFSEPNMQGEASPDKDAKFIKWIMKGIQAGSKGQSHPVAGYLGMSSNEYHKAAQKMGAVGDYFVHKTKAIKDITKSARWVNGDYKKLVDMKWDSPDGKQKLPMAEQLVMPVSEWHKTMGGGYGDPIDGLNLYISMLGREEHLEWGSNGKLKFKEGTGNVNQWKDFKEHGRARVLHQHYDPNHSSKNNADGGSITKEDFDSVTVADIFEGLFHHIELDGGEYDINAEQAAQLKDVEDANDDKLNKYVENTNQFVDELISNHSDEIQPLNDSEIEKIIYNFKKAQGGPGEIDKALKFSLFHVSSPEGATPYDSSYANIPQQYSMTDGSTENWMNNDWVSKIHDAIKNNKIGKGELFKKIDKDGNTLHYCLKPQGIQQLIDHHHEMEAIKVGPTVGPETAEKLAENDISDDALIEAQTNSVDDKAPLGNLGIPDEDIQKAADEVNEEKPARHPNNPTNYYQDFKQKVDNYVSSATYNKNNPYDMDGISALAADREAFVSAYQESKSHHDAGELPSDSGYTHPQWLKRSVVKAFNADNGVLLPDLLHSDIPTDLYNLDEHSDVPMAKALKNFQGAMYIAGNPTDWESDNMVIDHLGPGLADLKKSLMEMKRLNPQGNISSLFKYMKKNPQHFLTDFPATVFDESLEAMGVDPNEKDSVTWGQLEDEAINNADLAEVFNDNAKYYIEGESHPSNVLDQINHAEQKPSFPNPVQQLDAADHINAGTSISDESKTFIDNVVKHASQFIWPNPVQGKNILDSVGDHFNDVIPSILQTKLAIGDGEESVGDILSKNPETVHNFMGKLNNEISKVIDSAVTQHGAGNEGLLENVKRQFELGLIGPTQGGKNFGLLDIHGQSHLAMETAKANVIDYAKTKLDPNHSSFNGNDPSKLASTLSRTLQGFLIHSLNNEELTQVKNFFLDDIKNSFSEDDQEKLESTFTSMHDTFDELQAKHASPEGFDLQYGSGDLTDTPVHKHHEEWNKSDEPVEEPTAEEPTAEAKTDKPTAEEETTTEAPTEETTTTDTPKPADEETPPPPGGEGETGEEEPDERAKVEIMNELFGDDHDSKAAQKYKKYLDKQDAKKIDSLHEKHVIGGIERNAQKAKQDKILEEQKAQQEQAQKEKEEKAQKEKEAGVIPHKDNEVEQKIKDGESPKKMMRDLMAHKKNLGEHMSPKDVKNHQDAMDAVAKHMKDHHWGELDDEEQKHGDDAYGENHMKEAEEQDAQDKAHGDDYKNHIESDDDEHFKNRQNAFSAGQPGKFTEFDDNGDPSTDHHLELDKYGKGKMKMHVAGKGPEAATKDADGRPLGNGVAHVDGAEDDDDIKQGPPDPDVARKKKAEGYVWHEETRHWIKKESLKELQGGMGAHGAGVIHAGSIAGQKFGGPAPKPFAVDEHGNASDNHFVVHQGGIHQVGSASDKPPQFSNHAHTRGAALGHALKDKLPGKNGFSHLGDDALQSGGALGKSGISGSAHHNETPQTKPPGFKQSFIDAFKESSQKPLVTGSGKQASFMDIVTGKAKMQKSSDETALEELLRKYK